MEHQPFLEDTGLDMDAIFKFAKLGIVFQSVEMVEVPAGLAKESGISGTIPAVSATVEGPFAKIMDASSSGRLTHEEYSRICTNAVHLSPEEFARQYPEYGPYELSSGQAA